VWPVRLRASDAVTAQFAELLSADERERAGRFVFDHLRSSFTLSRGAMRVLLGRCLDARPAAIRFTYGEKGKPALESPGRIRFNVSHSGDLALFAITLDCEIGVDIERIHAMQDFAGIAKRFFSTEEEMDLMSLPEDQREAAFFRCWTRKEAYIKAIGDGFSAPLDGFAVTLRVDAPARLTHIAGDASAAAAWTVHDLEIEAGYAAALAYRDAPRAVRLFAPLDPAELLY
jgi:4'-phosphopantetheinyl transferase